jgi:hypothetical protein
VAQAFRDISNPLPNSYMGSWYEGIVKQQGAADSAADGQVLVQFPSVGSVWDFLIISPLLRNFDPHTGVTKEYFNALEDWHRGPHALNTTFFLHGGHQMMKSLQGRRRNNGGTGGASVGGAADDQLHPGLKC